MSDEQQQVSQLKREGTMAVTAQEAKEFLEAQGVQVTDDDVKTRGQKERLEQITQPNGSKAEPNGSEDEPNGSEDEPNGEKRPGQANNTDDNKPKVVRDNTMITTAKEAVGILEGEQLEKTRGQTAQVKETTEEIVSPTKPKIERESTMVVTAQEGAEILDGEELEKTRSQTAAVKELQAVDDEQSKLKRTTTIAKTTEDSQAILGNEEYGKTRSQTRKFSESEEKKPAVKRTSTIAQTVQEGEEFLANESKRHKSDDDNGDDVPLPEAVEMAED